MPFHRQTVRAALLLSGGMLAALLACNLSGVPSIQPQGGCDRRLDAETLSNLTISLNDRLPETISLPPGSTGDFSVGMVECCYIYNPVDACVNWSVEPTDGATIDPRTGVLNIGADVAAGSVYTVTADIEGGRSTLTEDVTVFTAEANPLVGRWHEVSQFACDSDAVRPADPAIRELIFEADGSFSVTWFPFEVYEDYWGTYTTELGTGALDMVVSSGNHIPDDMDISGTFEVDDQGRLLLHDLWFGSPPTGSIPTGCGHIFTH